MPVRERSLGVRLEEYFRFCSVKKCGQFCKWICWHQNVSLKESSFVQLCQNRKKEEGKKKKKENKKDMKTFNEDLPVFHIHILFLSVSPSVSTTCACDEGPIVQLKEQQFLLFKKKKRRVFLCSFVLYFACVP